MKVTTDIQILIMIAEAHGHQVIYLLVQQLQAKFMKLSLQVAAKFYRQAVIVGDLIRRPLINI